jgi:hypothetical protein
LFGKRNIKIVMVMIRLCFTAALMLLCMAARAQQVHQFKDGLAVGPCHRYGREAVVNDQLAYALAHGTLKAPAEGQALFVNEGGSTIAWKTVNADTAGRFRGEGLSNGYLYLTYSAAAEGSALLNVSGNAMCFVNGDPRGGDIYGDGWVNIPVKLKKGLNEFYVRCPPSARWQGVKAKLIFPAKGILLSTDDSTLPHIVLGEASESLWGAVVAINSTESTLAGFSITATLEGNSVTTTLPALPAMTTRKVGFQFNGTAAKAKKSYVCIVQLKQKGKVLDEKTVTIDAVNADDHHSYTFVSNIDGSIQYYSVAPQAGAPAKGGAFFLSVHGAGVQAIGQARAYKPKDWDVLVAPTNRRPRGFNWEDWGRLDAL